MWLGCYDNAFLLLRQCYKELKGNATKGRGRDWDDCFLRDSHIAVAGSSAQGGWVNWAVHFPPAPGLPGDPLDLQNPFSLLHYFARAVALLRTLLLNLETFRTSSASGPGVDTQSDEPQANLAALIARATSLLRIGALASAAVAVEALALVEAALKSIPKVPENTLLPLLEAIAASVRKQFEQVVATDDHIRYQWEIIDLILANSGRSGAVQTAHRPPWPGRNQSSRPQGMAAPERRVGTRPGLRVHARALLDRTRVRGRRREASCDSSGRGAARHAPHVLHLPRRLFWKMRAGMGDVVFAPFYEALRRRGVPFKFFHRLEMSGWRTRTAGARRTTPRRGAGIRHPGGDEGREYRPLIDVRGLASWPASPTTGSFDGGRQMRARATGVRIVLGSPQGSHAELRVIDDFDFVVLGIGVGGSPTLHRYHRARPPLADDGRPRQDRRHPVVPNLDATRTERAGVAAPDDDGDRFVQPFDTWADMSQALPQESWRRHPPRTVAYFCTSSPTRPPEWTLATSGIRAPA